MACWARADSGSTQAIMSLSTNGGTARYTLAAAGSVGGDPLQAGTTNSGGTGANAVTSSGFSSAWFHGAAVFASTTSRAAYINGGSKGTDATNITGGADRILIGARISTTVGAFLLGECAEVGVWNIALSDDDVASLATGMSPLLVRPEGLVFYAPLLRDFVDFKGLSLTNTAGVTVYQDTPRFYKM
jgi:hypothetical protein